jgi:hypothetical protein
VTVRRVSIVVTCDACDVEIQEETEGDSAVRFTVRGEEREMDLCGDCLHGTFLQEARPVTNRKKRKKASDEFACHCGKTFGTARGLSAHQTRQAHD